MLFRMYFSMDELYNYLFLLFVFMDQIWPYQATRKHSLASAAILRKSVTLNTSLGKLLLLFSAEYETVRREKKMSQGHILQQENSTALWGEIET